MISAYTHDAMLCVRVRVYMCCSQDPLLADGTTWQCGVCSDFGYDTYLQNDPIYKNMELWTANGKNSTA